MRHQVLPIASAGLALLLAATTAAWADPPSTARRLLDASGIRGGLVVHLPCGDAALTAALRADDRYLVQGLDTDAARVAAARERLWREGVYGPVSVDHWTGPRLPYADNLVNLLVIDGQVELSREETLRVLAPGGVALRIADGGRLAGDRVVKPWPEEIDQWTHFLYDATGNAVSQDRVVGPPRHMQWVAGPRSARGHENLGSLSVAVSANGRMFSIADEGPIASVELPSRWRLIARDAFSGVLLWKKDIDRWEWALRPFRSGPPQLHRRLVAVGDTVYATLGYGEPLTALEAATGDLQRTYEGTAGTEEIVCDGGLLYLVAGDPDDQTAVDAAVRRGEQLPAVKRRIMAVKADSGSILWETPAAAAPELFALTLISDGRRVYYQDAEAVRARDAATGELAWQAPRPASLRRRAWASPTLVVHDGVVLSADQVPRQAGESATDDSVVDWEVTLAGGGQDGEIAAYAADTGAPLWTGPCRQTYNAPPDVLIADGLLWTGSLVQAKEPGITQAVDIHTGKVVRSRPADQEFYNPGMGHHRCYRNKATCEYLVMGRSGVEFVDLESGDAAAHHWIRGTCQHGIVPCNGLLYVPPHTCGCFIKAKLNGFNALAPAGVATGLEAAGQRLQRGPASRAMAAGPSSSKPADASAVAPDWPTHRGDPARSGAAKGPIATDLQQRWQAELGGKLSAVVVAGGRAFVAQVDQHTVHALDAASGRPLWSHVAGGRVDSPPTVDGQRLIFGSADGWVTCLRADDGQLAWRFRAAPGERRVVSYDQLESAWPVSGSVLVLDGVVYCAAGRSSFLDGGIRLVRLDAATGELLSETTLTGYDESGESADWAVRVQGTEMGGALPDVLSSDGERVFLRHIAFDRQGVESKASVPHLFSSVGFLDDSWWHRTYWIWGTEFRAGWGGWWQVGNLVPSGRLLVFDDQLIYGFGRSFLPHGNSGQWQIGEYYRYFAAPKEFVVQRESAEPAAEGAKQAKAARRGESPVTGRSIVPVRWSQQADLEARAMVLAGDVLFVAGPLGETHRSLAAFEGQEGIRLRALSTAEGKTLAEWQLAALPVFDGLSAAAGGLYLATRDGRVTCYAPAEPR